MDLDGLTEVLDRIQARGDPGHGARVRGPLAGGVGAGLPHGDAVRLRVRRPPGGEAAGRALPQPLPAGRSAAGRDAGRPAQAGRRGRGDGPRRRAPPPGSGPAAPRSWRSCCTSWATSRTRRSPARCLSAHEGGGYREWTRDLAAGRADRAQSDGSWGVGERRWVHAERLAEYRRPPGAPPAGAAPAPGAQRPADGHRPGPALRAGGGDGHAALRSLGDDVACGRFTRRPGTEAPGTPGRGRASRGWSSGSTAGPWSRCTAGR